MGSAIELVQLAQQHSQLVLPPLVPQMPAPLQLSSIEPGDDATLQPALPLQILLPYYSPLLFAALSVHRFSKNIILFSMSTLGFLKRTISSLVNCQVG